MNADPEQVKQLLSEPATAEERATETGMDVEVTFGIHRGNNELDDDTT